MPRRIYTPSNLGLGQSGIPFGGGIEQIGSGKGMGRGFKAFGPSSGGAIMDPVAAGLVPAPTQAPTPVAPHLRINFDTIGQTIPVTLGNVRLALRPIWAEGIVESGDESISPTQTFAGALCAPIDPDEDGEIFSVWESDTQISIEGSVVAPVGWSDADVALLAASLAGITVYKGNEWQLPDPRISADKGAARTNAFRGLRYVIVPSYPIAAGRGGGGGAGGLPNLSFGFRRTNDGGETKQQKGEPPFDGLAVEFLDGTL